MIGWLCWAATAAVVSASSPDDADISRRAEQLVARMTIEQKVGQLLMVGFGGKVMDAQVAQFFDQTQAGAVALFARNVSTSPTKTLQLIRAVRQHDPVVDGVVIPPFLAIDQEGGTVVRLKTLVATPASGMALGAANDEGLARAAGAAMGEDLALWGFNMNLAPVLDVNSNPDNPVIGVRSLGSDPNRVASLGAAYVAGMQSAGVLAVAKHFPGHGDTAQDSHYHLPSLPHDRSRLDRVELLPFKTAIDGGLAAIMTAHIALPTITHNDLPATLSPVVLHDILRNDLHFDGVVMTDGLEMQGIVEQFGSGEAAVRAVLAGADMVMVLWSAEKKKEVRDALLNAAHSGRLPATRLNEAVSRILRTKLRHGLFERVLPSTKVALQQLQKRPRRVVRDVAERAITVLRGASSLPVRSDQTMVISTRPTFITAMGNVVATAALTNQPTPLQRNADADRVMAQLALLPATSTVVFAVENDDHAELLKRVVRSHRTMTIVVVAFSSPYWLRAFPTIPVVVCSFGWRDDSLKAVAKVLRGDLQARGVPPISIGAVSAEPPTPH
jgi:beta-N-acetylhexosaminidase